MPKNMQAGTGNIPMLGGGISDGITYRERFSIMYTTGWRRHLRKLLAQGGMGPASVIAGMEAAEAHCHTCTGLMVNLQNKQFTLLSPTTPDERANPVIIF